MRCFRFSLRGMFGAVSLLAAGFGLTIYATPLIASLAVCAAALVLMASVLAGFLCAGSRRAFWIGFAVFGFGYLWAVCGSWHWPDGTQLLRDRLVTTAVLRWCHEQLPHTTSVRALCQTIASGEGIAQVDLPAGMPVAEGRLLQITYNMPEGALAPVEFAPDPSGSVPVALSAVARAGWADFAATGHALFAIAVALAGGAVGKVIHRARPTT